MASYLLFRSAGSTWPADLKPDEDRPSSADALTNLNHEDNVLYVLGYASPLTCLLEAVDREGTTNPSSELESWRACCEAMLQLKRYHSDRCRLVNLSELNQSGLRELASEMGIELTDQQSFAESSSTEPSQADSLLILAMTERMDLVDLYADLELNADLYGREPKVSLGLPSYYPHERSDLMIRAWMQHEILKTRQTVLSIECNGLQMDNEKLREKLNEADEESQLLMLQLKQLQEEVITIHTELQASRSQSQEAENRASELGVYIDTLRIECNYLLSKSQARPDLDKQRIPLLLNELRSNLYG